MHQWNDFNQNQNWNYLYFQVSPSSHSISCVRFCRHFIFGRSCWVLKFFLFSSLGSWPLDFKSIFLLNLNWFEVHRLGKRKNPTRPVKDVIRTTKPKPGDRRSYKTCWNCHVNDKRPTGKERKQNDGEK